MVTPEGIANGQYWRLISWIFLPLRRPPQLWSSVFSAFFMFIILRISFLFSDSLENAWGEIQGLSLRLHYDYLPELWLSTFRPLDFFRLLSLTNQMFLHRAIFRVSRLFSPM